ncbi:predicted protein [Plenodomus lingam JN3]|uniref:Predicted protein n=1 Tax=Leptosphaeria maculans (strain JN3 / isolate v23.1.3 / race Av1-4-5-6-7-8) TaxID=985895 RepID=E4ZZV7_LEPMJ|nr:predicted protein [Plenodomus lingam JN3]CBX96817.1 predicted protein [Plenodomus lingam JN3]
MNTTVQLSQLGSKSWACLAAGHLDYLACCHLRDQVIMEAYITSRASSAPRAIPEYPVNS